MCRVVRVLCAAVNARALAALKRGAVAAEYELVGGAANGVDLREQLVAEAPDVLVIDAVLAAEVEDLLAEARANRSPLRVIVAGEGSEGEDVVPLEDVRDAIRGLPRPGGPVR